MHNSPIITIETGTGIPTQLRAKTKPSSILIGLIELHSKTFVDGADKYDKTDSSSINPMVDTAAVLRLYLVILFTYFPLTAT